jgi:hypothetical protein
LSILVGIIADTHIPKVGERLPEEVLFQLRGVDLIVHAGDLVSLAVIGQLEGVAPVKAVAGNMDFPEVRERLPEKEILNLEGVHIGITHGSGPPWGIEKRILRGFQGMDVVVFGHTHRALVERRKGVLLLNPGSPNDTRFHPHTSLIRLRIDKGKTYPELIMLK